MDKNLPIYACKEKIVDAIKKNDTVIITAETGSGKTTQVPQYLYEQGYNVIVTQPRRIACVSLANRTQEEMGVDNNIIGYQTAFERNCSQDVRILFCTDGLQAARGIKDYDNTILIIDEAHEWNLHIETLIAWIKKFRKDGGRIKLVVMSATLEAKELLEYYGQGELISVPNRMFEVTRQHERAYKFIPKIVSLAEEGKNVLAFLPGQKEIMDTAKAIKDSAPYTDMQIIPLYGRLTLEEQQKAFKEYQVPKIVLATNVAQTSLTIPDIDAVVDMGTEKRLEVEDGIESLSICDISQADIDQRAGRAGRTRNGTYTLCSEIFYEERSEHTDPDINRLNLDRVVLRLASVGIDAEELEFFHQPNKERIRKSKALLRRIESLDKDDAITEEGRRIALIPLSVRYAKMILEAEKYGKDTVSTVVIMSAILEAGTLLNYSTKINDNFGKERKSEYRDFSRRKNSDLLAEVDIYKKAAAHAFPSLSQVGISAKAFKRIENLVWRMENILDGIISPPEYGTYRDEDAIRCVAIGLLDSLAKSDYTGSYINSEGLKIVLPKTTCITRPPAFLVGIPKQLETMSGENIVIMTAATGVPLSTVFSVIPEGEEKERILPETILYNPETKKFSFKYETVYSNLVLDKGSREVASDSPTGKQILESYPGIKGRTKENQILLNGRTFEVLEQEIGLDKEEQHIVVLEKHDILSMQKGSAKTYNGKPITFRCGLKLSQTIEGFFSDNRESVQSIYQDQYGAVKKIRAVANRWKEITEKNKTLTEGYLGLVGISDGVVVYLFDAKKTAEAETRKAIRTRFRTEVDKRYPRLAFRSVTPSGMKKNTAESDIAFRGFAHLERNLIENLTPDNMMDSLNRIEDAFRKTIDELKHKN